MRIPLRPRRRIRPSLRRELHEEAGLVLAADPPHVWHQLVVDPGHADGHDGILNDYFLVRPKRFDPRGALSDADLAAEHISGMRWWRATDIAEYDGTDLFSPRDIATPRVALIAGDLPATPLTLGLRRAAPLKEGGMEPPLATACNRGHLGAAVPSWLRETSHRR